MMLVHKYAVPPRQLFSLDMPAGAEVLCVKLQGKDRAPCFWALVDTALPIQRRAFRLVCTGQEVDKDEAARLTFIDTIMMENGDFVVHVFERAEAGAA